MMATGAHDDADDAEVPLERPRARVAAPTESQTAAATVLASLARTRSTGPQAVALHAAPATLAKPVVTTAGAGAPTSAVKRLALVSPSLPAHVPESVTHPAAAAPTTRARGGRVSKLSLATKRPPTPVAVAAAAVVPVVVPAGVVRRRGRGDDASDDAASESGAGNDSSLDERTVPSPLEPAGGVRRRDDDWVLADSQESAAPARKHRRTSILRRPIPCGAGAN